MTDNSNSKNGQGSLIQVYGQDQTLIENCVVNDSVGNGGGIGVWSNTYNSGASGNRIYGNVVIGALVWAYEATGNTVPLKGNDFESNLALHNHYCIRNGGDSAMTVMGNTFVNVDGSDPVLSMVAFAQSGYPSGFLLNTLDRNNSYLAGASGAIGAWGNYVGKMDNDYDNTFNTSPPSSGGAHNLNVNPGYDTATYGNGAYLMVPSPLKGKGAAGADIGASILYQYVDGKPTATPLWPWPMESRIVAETGMSATWEDDGHGHKGGLWKTLDGVYPAGPPALEAGPPTDELSDRGRGVSPPGETGVTTDSVSPNGSGLNKLQSGCGCVVGDRPPAAWNGVLLSMLAILATGYRRGRARRLTRPRQRR